jgi:hypothetical protein
MPRVATSTQTASATSFVPVVWEVVPILVTPARTRSVCGEVFHLHCKRLQLLKGRTCARGLEVDPQAVGFYQADVAELLGLFGKEIAAALSNFVEFVIKLCDVTPALQIL